MIRDQVQVRLYIWLDMMIIAHGDFTLNLDIM